MSAAMEVERPQIRGDCRGGVRPCPYVSCRHHLLLIVSGAGSLAVARNDNTATTKRRVLKEKETATQLVEKWLDDAADALFEMPETCALDVAEKDEHTYEQIGSLLGMSKQAVEEHSRNAALGFQVGARQLGSLDDLRDAVANDEHEDDWRMRMPAQSARKAGAE